MTSQAPRRSITIVELSVVIASLCILFTMLCPFLIKSGKRKAFGSCLANEQKLAKAMQEYLSDHDGIYPLGKRETAAGWAGVLYPYIRHTKVFQCPDDPSQPAFDTAPYVVSYGMNSNLGGEAPSFAGVDIVQTRVTRFPQLQNPGKTVLFFEVSSNASSLDLDETESPAGNGVQNPENKISSLRGMGGAYFVDQVTHVTRYATGNLGGRPSTFETLPPPRHHGGANYVACDGHVLWLPPHAVSSGFNSVNSDCSQGAAQSPASSCRRQAPDNAAGTANGKYQLTFSIR